MKIKTYMGIEMTEQEYDQFSRWLTNCFSVYFATLNTFYYNQATHIIKKWLELKRGEDFYSPIDAAKIIFDSVPEWDGVKYPNQP
jgi:hypothetical protein